MPSSLHCPIKTHLQHPQQLPPFTVFCLEFSIGFPGTQMPISTLSPPKFPKPDAMTSCYSSGESFKRCPEENVQFVNPSLHMAANSYLNATTNNQTPL